jgi:hypothetical protein
MNPPTSRRNFVKTTVAGLGMLSLPNLLQANPQHPHKRKRSFALAAIPMIRKAGAAAL